MKKRILFPLIAVVASSLFFLGSRKQVCEMTSTSMTSLEPAAPEGKNVSVTSNNNSEIPNGREPLREEKKLTDRDSYKLASETQPTFRTPPRAPIDLNELQWRNPTELKEATATAWISNDELLPWGKRFDSTLFRNAELNRKRILPLEDGIFYGILTTLNQYFVEGGSEELASTENLFTSDRRSELQDFNLSLSFATTSDFGQLTRVNWIAFKEDPEARLGTNTSTFHSPFERNELYFNVIHFPSASFRGIYTRDADRLEKNCKEILFVTSIYTYSSDEIDSWNGRAYCRMDRTVMEAIGQFSLKPRKTKADSN